MANESPKLLTSREAAELLRIKVRRLDDFRALGRISFVQYDKGKKGSKVLFYEADVLKFMEDNTVHAATN